MCLFIDAWYTFVSFVAKPLPLNLFYDLFLGKLAHVCLLQLRSAGVVVDVVLWRCTRNQVVNKLAAGALVLELALCDHVGEGLI